MRRNSTVAAAMRDTVRLKRPGWTSLFRAIIVLLVIVSLGFWIYRSLEHWNQQPPEARLRLKDIDFRWLLASAGLYAFGLLPATMVLSRALDALGTAPSLPLVAAAQLIGHLGKYVPGKAMVIIIRAAVLNRGGSLVTLRAATLAIMIETLTMISTGAVLGLLVLLFHDVPLWMKQAIALMGVAAALSTCPPMLRIAMARRVIGGTLPFVWTARDMVAAWFWNVVGWLLLGASLAAVVLALPELSRDTSSPSPVSLYLICLASIALAYVAGFLSLLPGGVGVREVVLTTMLALVTDPSGALVAAFVLRITHLIVEIVMSGLAWGFLSRVVPRATNMDDRPLLS